MAFASAPAVAVMESTEIAPGARFYVGKFARRVSRRYQAYMRRKREAESLLRIIRHYTVMTVKAAVRMGKFARRVGKKYQAYMELKRRINDRAWICNCGAPECCFCALTQRLLLASPRALQRAANLAGGRSPARAVGHLQAEAEELSDRTTDEFHSEAGSIAHGTGGHGGSSDGSGGGGGRREAQKQHKEVKARQSAQGGGEK